MGSAHGNKIGGPSQNFKIGRQYTSVARIRQCKNIGSKGFATCKSRKSGPVSVLRDYFFPIQGHCFWIGIFFR